MTLKINCFGISESEANELEEFLSDLEGVEWAGTAYADEALRPGEIQASAREMHLLVDLAIGASGSVGATFMNEASKDLYKAAKEYILQRLEAWKQARIPESRHGRVAFEFDERDELVRRKN